MTNQMENAAEPTGTTGTATSADGTTIAYEAWGSGPVVVLVGGAFNDRGTWTELARHLSRLFTAVSYDRRGRGDSGDTRTYAVEREIEDLTAVIRAVSGEEGTAYVHGTSSGAVLALRAAAAGAPIRAVSGLEPPFRVPSGPPMPEGYLETLQQHLAAGRNGDAVAHFMTQAVGQPPEQVEQMRGMPMWPALEAMAPTLIYDGLVVGDADGVPTDVLGAVTVPALVVSSTGSAPWLAEAARATAEAVPGGRYGELEGDFHQVPTGILAPSLAGFYADAADCSTEPSG
jgi:pimeloyl-ACP methyl ester carboxylesterase